MRPRGNAGPGARRSPLAVGLAVGLISLVGVVGWHVQCYRRVRAHAQGLRVQLAHDCVVGAGPGPPVRLALLGDSTVEGDGLDDPRTAMPGQVAAALVAATGRAVDVRAFGRSGLRVGRVLTTQVPRLIGLEADAVVISAGVNDGLGRRPPWRVAADTAALLVAVRQVAPTAALCLVGCIDIRTAPALPRPANRVIGWHFARTQRAQLRAAAASGVPAVPVPDPPPVDHYGPDGIHPGVDGIAWLAERVAAELVAQLDRPTVMPAGLRSS